MDVRSFCTQPTDVKKWDSDLLVTPAWLKSKLQNKDKPIKIIDATWSLDRPNYAQDFLQSHIPGAVFFDINKIADTQTDLPHMIPGPAQFASEISKLGVSNSDHLVIYDRSGNFVASARAWWTFRVFGHALDKIHLLEGGLARWKHEGGEIEEGPQQEQQAGSYRAAFNTDLVQDLNQMLVNIEGKKQIADARSYGRYIGTDPEPRPVRSGHMPNSKCVHFLTLMERDDPNNPWYTFKPKDKLIETFTKAGIDVQKPVVTTCGSGVTACVLAVGLHLSGSTNYSVYDGSWAEWAKAELNTPVEKGESK